jgi:hypothetical protein
VTTSPATSVKDRPDDDERAADAGGLDERRSNDRADPDCRHREPPDGAEHAGEDGVVDDALQQREPGDVLDAVRCATTARSTNATSPCGSTASRAIGKP